jgi:phosphomannomutase
MITGSHVPADRNGLKFYTRKGEITKADEAAIVAARGETRCEMASLGTLTPADASRGYVRRYRDAFGPAALAGRRIGVWTHSAVGRDLLMETLEALGAETVELGRADRFVPIDTEAVAPEIRAMLHRTAAEHRFDAIASTDGDGDRPLLTDAAGTIIPGDILGQITARLLDARVVVTPVTSNTGVDACGFLRVVRTRIGSPFVIAAMQEIQVENAAERVAGYEANGGFLLGFRAQGLEGPLPPLMTRDAFLPIIAPLALAAGGGLAALVAAQPGRVTAAERLPNVPTSRSAALVARLGEDTRARAAFVSGFGEALAGLDLTDGLRLTLTSGRIVHLRPSGNAPELRLYTEAESLEAAQTLLRAGLALLRQRLG